MTPLHPAPQEGIPEALVGPLADWLEATVGLSFTPANRRLFEQRMAAAKKEFGFDDLESFSSWLISQSPTRSQIEKLAAHLTIGETYFYREQTALRVLDRHFLPQLLQSRRRSEKRLRIWSAGCSTGEEPYSLAILLDRLVPDLNDWNVSILATDINPLALRKAEQGIYSEWSFRDTPPWFKERYFERVDGRHYLLRSDIRAMVTFAYLNLGAEGYPSIQSGTNALDFIFCRNVLIYFSPEQIRKVVDRFHRALLDGGYLIVSPVETPYVTGSPFTVVHQEGWTFHRKSLQRAVSPPPPAAAPAAGSARRQPSAPPAPRASRPPARPAPAGQAVPSPAGPATSVPAVSLATAAKLYETGRFAEAETQLRGLVAAGDRSHETAALFARVLANRGQLDEAARWCEEALSVLRTDAGLHYLWATILLEEQRMAEARVALTRALYLDPDFVLAQFALANIALQTGKPAEARRHLDNVRATLQRYEPDAVLPESDGLTATGLAQMITAVSLQEGV